MKLKKMAKQGFLCFYLLMHSLFIFAKDNRLFPSVEGVPLSQSEALFYQNDATTLQFFRLNTSEIVDLCEKNKGSNFNFTLNVGNISIDLNLSVQSSRLWRQTHNNTQRYTYVLKGGVVDRSGNAFISVSPQSFEAKIVMDGMVILINNAERNGKMVPDIYVISERPVEDFDISPPGMLPTCPGYIIDLGIQVDQEFVAHYSSFPNPLEKAFETAIDALSIASGTWSTILPSMQLDFVFIAGPPATDISTSDFAVWAGNIRSNWSTVRPCMKTDGIVYFTGKDGPRGVTNPTDFYICKDPDFFGRMVSIISGPACAWTPLRLGQVTAHEIGHMFGLRHEDEVCGIDCSDGQTALLMCGSHGPVKALSACNLANLNSNFNNPKCPCLVVDLPSYQSEVCERCYPTFTEMTVDNPKPMLDCGTDRDLMHFNMKIEGGCTPVNGIVLRARFRKDLAHVVSGQFSNYFTHTRIVAGNFTELIARVDPNGPNNDTTNPEKTVNFEDVNSNLLINFALRYVQESTLEDGKYSVYAYVGDFNANAGSNDVTLVPYFSKYVPLGRGIQDVIEPETYGRDFVIHGDINLSNWALLGEPAKGYLYTASSEAGYFFDGFNFLFTDPDPFHMVGPGNGIYAIPGTKLKMVNCSIQGCETMWQGIEVGGSVEIVSSTIKDAQVAVNIANSAKNADIRNSVFEDNNYGIQALLTPSAIQPAISILGNTFKTQGDLKSLYPGQTPAPFGNIGYAGVSIQCSGNQY